MRDVSPSQPCARLKPKIPNLIFLIHWLVYNMICKYLYSDIQRIQIIVLGTILGLIKIPSRSLGQNVFTRKSNEIKLSKYSTSTYCGRNLKRPRSGRYWYTCLTGQARAALSCCPQQVPDLTPWPNLGPWPRSLRGQPTLYKEGILSPKNHAIFIRAL